MSGLADSYSGYIQQEQLRAQSETKSERRRGAVMIDAARPELRSSSHL